MYVIAEEIVPSAITVELAKQHLRITHPQENDIIQTYIDSATLFVESYSGLRMVDRDVTIQAEMWDGRWRLPKCTRAIKSAWIGDRERKDLSLVAGYARAPEGICLAGPAEIVLSCGVAADTASVPPTHRGPVLAAVAHLYTSREGQDYPAGIYAACRALPGGGIRF